jgi:predicted phosphodiesterase
MSQDLINFLIAVLGVGLGWWMKMLSDTHKDLRAEDERISEKVQKIEVLVVGDYMRREELAKLMDALFAKLDRIESKVDNKVNREDCSMCRTQ